MSESKLKELSKNSKIKEVYQNPVGHDILQKLLLQIGKEESILTNPFVGNMKLKTISKFVGNKLGDDFIDSFVNLLNHEHELPLDDGAAQTKAWWKEAVFYQIYPRSFKDSNGDGIGDLGGIIEKLDYLKDLGVDALWLSPIYDSPNDDNGYDIRDYQKIMQEFGSMEDFDKLLEGIHERGMRLIMDLVVNHTSDEHRWFQEAISNPDSPYRDYYFIKEGEANSFPNNWTSFFSEPAWNYYQDQKVWALHSFSRKQMDINWDNPKVREEVCDIVNWWLEKGVDGFRMDVISIVSKTKGLPDGNDGIGEMMGIRGIEHYFYGPNLHQYMHEMHENSFAKHNAFSVGETPGIGMEMAKLLTSDYRKEMDMLFNFDHLEMPGKTRFDEYKYDLNFYKKYITSWMENYGSHCQMSLFYENHDNPRIISKIDPDAVYRKELGKLLALIQLTLKGTPFIFQGQEMGAVNEHFSDIKQLNDVESLNLYRKLIKENARNKEEIFNKIISGTRDHARTPVQWDASESAGFTTGKAWLWQDDDYKEWNIENQLKDEDSILSFYKKLLAFRKTTDAFTYGAIKITNKKKKDLFTYYRDGYYIECNISNHPVKRPVEKEDMEMILSNYNDWKEDTLLPYEANLYKIC